MASKDAHIIPTQTLKDMFIRRKCQAWTPAMSRCGNVGQLDDRASGSLPTRPKGNGSLSGRARERKLLVGKGER